MVSYPSAAVEHYRQVLALEKQAVGASKRFVNELNIYRLEESFGSYLPIFVASVEALQKKAAVDGASYSASVLAEQGDYVAPVEFADPDAFTGWLMDDSSPYWRVSVSDAAAGAGVRMLDLLQKGIGAREAVTFVRSRLDRLSMTAVADSSRQAAMVDAATRPGTGYVRMLNPPSCSRCVVLAGRFYRWNAGFQRHPNCDCVHILVTDKAIRAGKAEGFVSDPYEYFNSLSQVEQARIFTKYGAQAIRDGADIYRVVNARRSLASYYTGEGAYSASNRARAYAMRFNPSHPGRSWTYAGVKGSGANDVEWYVGNRGRLRRLTPEGVYARAKNRQEAIEGLKKAGYILSSGQVPGGSIVGWNYTGYGQLGAAGASKKARDGIEHWLRTGERIPGLRHTMTAAERRVVDAKWRWEVALAGYDPYSPGASSLFRGNSVKGGQLRRSNPEMIANLEREYRYWLARKGHIYFSGE